MGRVYAVASGKGGVGKTTTTANLGTTLAAAGRETVVVDADLGMANLGATLGVADEGPTLHDVLAGEAAVGDAIRESPGRPAVLPGSRDLDDFSAASPDALADVLDALAEGYEHVIVDTGAGLSADSLAPLRAADEVVLVSTPDPVALDDTAKTAAVTRRVGTPLRGFVIVRAGGEGTDRVRERVDGEVLGTIPEDAAVADAMAAGVPLVEFAPRSPAAGAYRRLAATLTGVDVPAPETAAEGADAGEAAAGADADTPAGPDDGATDAADEAADGSDGGGTGVEDADAGTDTDAGARTTADAQGGDADDVTGTETEDGRADEGGTGAADDGGAEAGAEDDGGAEPAGDDEDSDEVEADPGADDEDSDDGGEKSKGFLGRLFG